MPPTTITRYIVNKLFLEANVYRIFRVTTTLPLKLNVFDKYVFK